VAGLSVAISSSPAGVERVVAVRAVFEVGSNVVAGFISTPDSGASSSTAASTRASAVGSGADWVVVERGRLVVVVA
jgi:hypothetical protein